MMDKLFPTLVKGRAGLLTACVVTVALVAVTTSRANQAEVDDATCLSCHEGHDTGLAGSGHALGLNGVNAVACASCHSGGATHIEDPSKDNIFNPATGRISESEKACTACHQPHPGLGLVGQDPHAGMDMACTKCHAVHKPARADESLCGKCHVAVTHQFTQRSNHPLLDGTVSCVSCHDFLGKGEASMGHGPSANCYACHTDQSGPFLFEHAAVSSFTVDGAGCVSCHNPHGSVNDRLLTQTDANLCKQCHGVPAGHMAAHGGQFSQVACIDCHSDIHGSYDNLFLLDPQLGTKFGREADACFCHYYR